MATSRFPSRPGGPDGICLSFFKVRSCSNFFFLPHNKATRRRATLQASLLFNRNCLVSNGSISSTSSNKETCSTPPTIIDGQATTRPLLSPGTPLHGLHLTIASTAIHSTTLATSAAQYTAAFKNAHLGRLAPMSFSRRARPAHHKTPFSPMASQIRCWSPAALWPTSFTIPSPFPFQAICPAQSLLSISTLLETST